MGSSKRLLVVLLAGLTFTFAGGFVMREKSKEFVEVPLLTAAAAPATTTTAVPVPTTVGAPAPAAPKASKPVSPPRNSYAPEPIVKIGTISIPKIGLVHDVYHGISMRNIDNGPSHWPGTAFPGEIGNTVFMGHRVTKTHPFRMIHELVPGDLIIYDIQGMKSTYAVTGSEVVPPTALSIVNPTETATTTIFACHPPGSAKYRYVVRGNLVDVTTG